MPLFPYRFFYSGLARRKSALSLIWVSIMAIGVTSFQWFFWGYSLSFSHSAGRFIGDLSNIGFRNVLGQPSVGSHKIPDLLFAVYQGMFAAITYVSQSRFLYHLSPDSSYSLPVSHPNFLPRNVLTSSVFHLGSPLLLALSPNAVVCSRV